MDPKFAAYSFRPTPGFLGRVALIATGEQLDTGLRGESHLLVERAERRLYATRITFELKRLPDGFDVDFIIAEAQNAADVRLSELRLHEFEQSKDWGIFSTPTVRTEIGHSMAAWATELSPWRRELKIISTNTQHASLGVFLTTVMTIQDLVIRDDLPLAP